MWRRIWATTQKEFIQLWRNRLVLPAILIGPIIELILFAVAIHTDVKHIPMAVADQSMSAASRSCSSKMPARLSKARTVTWRWPCAAAWRLGLRAAHPRRSSPRGGRTASACASRCSTATWGSTTDEGGGAAGLACAGPAPCPARP